jgi:hypothetical protein
MRGGMTVCVGNGEVSVGSSAIIPNPVKKVSTHEAHWPVNDGVYYCNTLKNIGTIILVKVIGTFSVPR